MTAFLRQVARHYCACGKDVGHMVFVFPSRRAVVFFRKHFAQEVKDSGAGPVIAPRLVTVEEFFSSLSDRKKENRLPLILRLYGCYRDICAADGLTCESLDEFVFWGGVILGDFDNVDKYLINAADIFRNVSELKDIGDDFSYLSRTQEEAMKTFLGHFRTEGEYKMRFARLWNMLGRLYVSFNASLDADNVCYEGKLLRELVSRVDRDGVEAVFHDRYPKADKVVFCGLNVLCSCEYGMLSKFRNLGLAEFCWDYCSKWIRDSHNKSSLFMEHNVSEFPQAFPLEPCEDVPALEVVSVPSAVGQTKAVSALLEREDVPADERTAIILPDESLLQPMLNSIPDRIRDVNVTMGYSMAWSSFYTLMNDISRLQLRLRAGEGGVSFYHRPFWDIAANNVFNAILDDRGREILRSLKSGRNYFIAEKDLKGSELLEKIFRPVVTDVKGTDPAQIRSIEEYQKEILEHIGSAIARNDDLKSRFALELDFAMEYVKAVNLVSCNVLNVMPQTYFGLLDNILRTQSVPIKGEPLTGLQIMGPLETRALDFDRIFILSCNEGVFPRPAADSSFIPPLLRKAFGLPGYEYQDAVWAYYFYRMLQRSSRVTMLYDTRSEGLRSGEESRYIKQLQYHFGADVSKVSAFAVPRPAEDSDVVVKTERHLDTIHSKELSPTALQQYLRCSMQFYYSYVLELRPDEEVSESMDAGIIGNTYHKVMQRLYSHRPGNLVTREYILGKRKDTAALAALVDEVAKKELHIDVISGRNIVFCEIICRYVQKTLDRDLEFLENEKADSFAVIALEKTYRGSFGGFRLKGKVDRVDSFRPGAIRLVDYKTGKVLQEDTDIDDSNAAKIADRIFDRSVSESSRPKIALQFFIYDLILDQEHVSDGNVLVNTVYSTRSLLQKPPVNVYRNSVFFKEMENRLTDCLREIDDLGVPFARKKREYGDKTCEYCDFKNICGR